MGDVCANCKHFDQDTTELPICELHRRFMSSEWTCGDFARRGKVGEDGDADATTS